MMAGKPALLKDYVPAALAGRVRLNEFSSAWLSANCRPAGSKPANLAMVDETLHAERRAFANVNPVMVALSRLPPGPMVEYEGATLLLADGNWFGWSFDGYCVAPPLPHRPADLRFLRRRCGASYRGRICNRQLCADVRNGVMCGY